MHGLLHTLRFGLCHLVHALGQDQWINVWISTGKTCKVFGSFGTWTRLNLGKFCQSCISGICRTCDLWLLTLNVQLLLRWLRMAARLCSWSLTQRISFIFGLDPRNTCLTALCTLQPKHREGHDFLALRGISISALKFAKRAKLDECRRNIPGAQTKMGKYFYTFWQPFGLIWIDIIEGLRRTYPNIRR